MQSPEHGLVLLLNERKTVLEGGSAVQITAAAIDLWLSGRRWGSCCCSFGEAAVAGLMLGSLREFVDVAAAAAAAAISSGLGELLGREKPVKKASQTFRFQLHNCLFLIYLALFV